MKSALDRREMTYLRGHRAEWIALLFLVAKGYRPLARRYAASGGEIDLIVMRGDTIAFVEVKSRTRTETDFDPLFAVDRRRIFRAAKIYVSRHPALMQRTLRFDIILLAPGTWPRHLINAFGADG